MRQRINEIEKYLQANNDRKCIVLKGELKFLKLLLQEGYILKSEYKNTTQKVLIECKNGHSWEVRVNNFFDGRRCPKCKKSEDKIFTTTKKCDVCGKEFIPSSPNDKRCSDECKKKNKKAKAKQRRENENDKEKMKHYLKEYREKNRDKIKELKKKYREVNKEKIKLYHQKYKKTDAYKIMSKNVKHRRRQREKNGVGITVEQWKSCLEFFGGKCAYSGEIAEDYHMDHIVPLSTGGEHSYYNIVPCMPKYNIQKSNKNMEEWYREQPYFSEERLNKIYEYMSLKEIS